MLDARKAQHQNRVSSTENHATHHATNDNTSELKTTEQQTEIGHELDSEHENQATINESDNVQQSASESDLDNMSDIKVETLSDETATNTTGNNYDEAKTTNSNKQQSDKLDTSKDNNVVSNHQSVNPDEYSGQSVQEPLLKPEPTSQLGGTKTSNENENKPTIRRGPNIKLPNVELLEAPKQHEVDESWIEDKNKS